MMETNAAMPRSKEIRKAIYRNEWWFSVVDVFAALTDSLDAGAYWRKLKQRLKLEGSEAATFCHGLQLPAPDGKMRETDCANTGGIFRTAEISKAAFGAVIVRLPWLERNRSCQGRSAEKAPVSRC